MNTILVTGSSGKVGRVITEQLRRAGEQVRAASRNPVGSDGVALDWSNPATFQPSLAEVKSVFLMSPSGEAQPKDFLLPFLEQAADGRRKIVLMSEGTTDVNETAPMRPVEVAVQSCGSPYVLLRPNWFMDNFHTYWLEPIRQAGILPLPAGDSRSAFIDTRDIGAAAAAVLRTDRFDGQALNLSGPAAIDYAEAAAILSQSSGRDINYISVDDESFVASLLEAGLPRPIADHITNLFRITRQGGASQVTTMVQDLTGRPPRKLHQYAQDYAKVWRR
jgi:uncharacterized protein YbjT (DUF2867 family)